MAVAAATMRVATRVARSALYTDDDAFAGYDDREVVLSGKCKAAAQGFCRQSAMHHLRPDKVEPLGTRDSLGIVRYEASADDTREFNALARNTFADIAQLHRLVERLSIDDKIIAKATLLSMSQLLVAPWSRTPPAISRSTTEETDISCDVPPYVACSWSASDTGSGGSSEASLMSLDAMFDLVFCEKLEPDSKEGSPG